MQAEEAWRDLMSTTPLGALDAPSGFSLDGAVVELGLPDRVNSCQVRRGKAPLIGIWWRLTWDGACTEVRQRYERLRVVLNAFREESRVEVNWSLEELYRSMHHIREHFDAGVEQKLLLTWHSVSDAEARAGRPIHAARLAASVKIKQKPYLMTRPSPTCGALWNRLSATSVGRRFRTRACRCTQSMTLH